MLYASFYTLYGRAPSHGSRPCPCHDHDHEVEVKQVRLVLKQKGGPKVVCRLIREVGEKHAKREKMNRQRSMSPVLSLLVRMLPGERGGMHQSSSIGASSFTPEPSVADADPDVPAGTAVAGDTSPCESAATCRIFVFPGPGELFTTVLVPMTRFRFATVDIPAACRAAFQIDCDVPLISALESESFCC